MFNKVEIQAKQMHAKYLRKTNENQLYVVDEVRTLILKPKQS